MSILKIDTDRYGEAAGLAAVAGQGISEAVLSTNSALMHTAGMAGWDAMGAEWSVSYDSAAREVLEACRELALASSDTSRALTYSAGNYIDAEHVASMGLSELVMPLLPASVPDATAPNLPSAGGADPGWPPPCWDIIAGLAGVVWPAGSPEMLRAAGTAWCTLADDVEANVSGPVRFAQDAVNGLMAEDLTLLRERSAAIHSAGVETAHASRDIAAGCTSLAEAVEAAHQELIDETQSFALECAGLVVAGTALSFVTLGGSAVITTLIGAARTAQMIARVHQVLTRLAALARAASVFASRMPGATRLTAGLQALAKTPAVLGTAARSAELTLVTAVRSPVMAATLSRLAPAVRIVRPLGKAGIQILDSKAVSVALSSPAALAREQLAWHVRRNVLGSSAVKGDLTEQAFAVLRTTGFRAPRTMPALEATLRAKDRVETVIDLAALPASSVARYAPGKIEGPAASAAGPGRLTAVQASPATGPTPASSRGRRTSRPATAQ
ncbi:hypothetical protein FDK12_13830 [Arthrobacter sp. NamB2]|uniref:hypothetical protein n=1 Tax=Arthrobacter sp. NamB2 TaxID=2576035 RepID=UPI0010C98F2A|nr:hypothetical protein [Arthrobacter sp. NamB2]TKV26447.1 hypothetical protein FDK12_13830 [Arthrobacter sp. NamB2]